MIALIPVVAASLSLALSQQVPAKEVGAQLFDDARFTLSDANSFACSTCHAVSAEDTWSHMPAPRSIAFSGSANA